MAGRTAEEAVDAFIDFIQAALSCITAGTAIASGRRLGRQAVTLYVPGQDVPNVACLDTHGGVGEVLFRFAHSFDVVQLPQPVVAEPFQVKTAGYQYRISDIASRELVSYEWHPVGNSPVVTPHLHVPVAGSIVLAQRPGSPRAQQRTHLGNMHFPTASIFLEDIIELLIREFDVVPLHPN